MMEVSFSVCYTLITLTTLLPRCSQSQTVEPTQYHYYGLNESTKEYSCDNPRFVFYHYLSWSIAPAMLIVLVLSSWQPRKKMCPGCCDNRPGIPFPVNLVDSYDDRLPFACAFAVTSSCILDLFLNVHFFQPDISNVPQMLAGTIQVIVGFVNVIEVCLAYYPLLLCLSTPALVLGNFLGFLYTLNWMFFYLIRFIDCPVGTGVLGNFNAEVLGPIYFCYCILLLRFAYGFGNAVGNWYRTSYKDTRIGNTSLSSSSSDVTVTQIEDNDPIFCAFKKTHYYQYVLALMKPTQKNESRCRRYLSKVYKVVPHTFWVTCWLSYTVVMISLFHGLVVYRRDSLMLYKGDRSAFPQDYSHPSIVVSSLRYSGYHIGYTLWEFFIFQITSWTLLFFIYFFIVIPLKEGYDSILINALRNYWLTLVLGYIFFYGQLLVVKYCCLHEKGRILGLNNRRWFHVVNYTFFFFHVITGLVSCLLRIIKSVIFGAMFIGRIDRCVLMRGFELWDSGYNAYFGFLKLEVAHTHPVLVTFCQILWSTIRLRRQETSIGFKVNIDNEVSLPETRKRNQVARNRWFVALTLMRNQHIFVNRKPLLPELERIRNERLQKQKSEISAMSVVVDGLDSAVTTSL
ncbi:stimulated by retinoic acid gene 6 protein-like [Anneissia japonica]|uniref:stimulated by retinoic acid gene 6 protein-like n=1 Tax=Anneissia japonica TaxID=1529436 RepID=UPI00142594ED|nr:stimulated by retinoic acid gene 6 protein-like [Anneissia japonica]